MKRTGLTLLTAVALLAGCDGVPDFARDALVDALQTEVQEIATEAIGDMTESVLDDVLGNLPFELPDLTPDDATGE